MKTKPITFGQRLRELRQHAGLTQAQLADRVGVSHVKISQWEHGVNVPMWENVCVLADSLGITTDSFRG